VEETFLSAVLGTWG